MSLLQALLTRFAALVNPTPTIASAVSDDGSGDEIDAGKPSPLRADPLSGAAKMFSASARALDIYLDGSDWKVALYAADRTTQIASTTIGTVSVNGSSIVTLPLDLEAMGGSPASELRIHATAASTIKVRHAKPANADFPVAELSVIDGEIIAQRITDIEAIAANITRISIAWGG